MIHFSFVFMWAKVNYFVLLHHSFYLVGTLLSYFIYQIIKVMKLFNKKIFMKL